MRERLSSASKFESLVISALFERFDRALANALIEPRQHAGVLLFDIPVFIRSSRQFIEVLRYGLSEFRRE